MTELDETIAALKTTRVVPVWDVTDSLQPAVVYVRGRNAMVVAPLPPEEGLTAVTLQFFYDGVGTDLAEFVLADD